MTDEEIREMCEDMNARGMIPPEIGLEQFIIGTKIILSITDDPARLREIVKAIRNDR